MLLIELIKKLTASTEKSFFFELRTNIFISLTSSYWTHILHTLCIELRQHASLIWWVTAEEKVNSCFFARSSVRSSDYNSVNSWAKIDVFEAQNLKKPEGLAKGHKNKSSLKFS